MKKLSECEKGYRRWISPNSFKDIKKKVEADLKDLQAKRRVTRQQLDEPFTI